MARKPKTTTKTLSELRKEVKDLKRKIRQIREKKHELIPRPKVVGGFRGYNLQNEMGLSDDRGQYNKLAAASRELACKHLNLGRTITRQDQNLVSEVIKIAQEQHKFLRRFEQGWPVYDFINQYLRHCISRRAKDEDEDPESSDKDSVGISSSRDSDSYDGSEASESDKENERSDEDQTEYEDKDTEDEEENNYPSLRVLRGSKNQNAKNHSKQQQKKTAGKTSTGLKGRSDSLILYNKAQNKPTGLSKRKFTDLVDLRNVNPRSYKKTRFKEPESDNDEEQTIWNRLANVKAKAGTQKSRSQGARKYNK